MKLAENTPNHLSKFTLGRLLGEENTDQMKQDPEFALGYFINSGKLGDLIRTRYDDETAISVTTEICEVFESNKKHRKATEDVILGLLQNLNSSSPIDTYE